MAVLSKQDNIGLKGIVSYTAWLQSTSSDEVKPGSDLVIASCQSDPNVDGLLTGPTLQPKTLVN